MSTKDPNLVTSDQIDAKTDATEAAPGAVLKKGAPPPEAKPRAKADDLVTVRITKAGHGQVHDGEDGRYDWNDEVILPRSVGVALEGRNFGEIQD